MLVVALSEPDNLTAIDEIAFATGLKVKPVLAAEADVEQAIRRLLDGAPPLPPQGVDLPEGRVDERMDLVRPPRTPRG